MSTPTPEALYLGDMRRAAVFVAHHANKDSEGVTSVLQEANATDRATELLVAVCDLYQLLVPLLVTPLGLNALHQTILSMTAREEEQGT